MYNYHLQVKKKRKIIKEDREKEKEKGAIFSIIGWVREYNLIVSRV